MMELVTVTDFGVLYLKISILCVSRLTVNNLRLIKATGLFPDWIKCIDY